MLRTMSWGVAAGATLLISLTACAVPGSPGAASTAGGAGDVCGLLAAPVTAALVQNGITATPINDGTSAACQWKDPVSETTVTLKTDAAAGTGKDGQAVETTTVPGAGEVTVVGPGEVTFTAAGRPWDLLVESKNSDEVDTKTATDLVAAITGAIGGGTGTGAGAAGSTSSDTGTTQKDSTVTVTDTDGRTTDLMSSTVQVEGQDSVALGNGQTVPLNKVTKIEFSDADLSNRNGAFTLTDGQTTSGTVYFKSPVQGQSDFGSFRLTIDKVTSVEWKRDTPFEATPEPKLTPWGSATAVVTEVTGKTSNVKAPTLRFLSDNSVTLDNGQTVAFEKITKLESKADLDRNIAQITITLVTGRTVTGTADPHISTDGDTDGATFSSTLDQVKTITIDRGTATS